MQTSYLYSGNIFGICKFEKEKIKKIMYCKNVLKNKIPVKKIIEGSLEH